jgi:IS5 family transposase
MLHVTKMVPPRLNFQRFNGVNINSDPELESQINDGTSFKKFLGLSLSDPFPDHSTFSRFRKRLPKEAMTQINTEILRQFENQGLTINEGVPSMPGL